MTTLSRARILIIDLRSQTTKLIERSVRELGYRSAILDPAKAKAWLRGSIDTDAIILSGGDFSIYQENAPRPPEEIFTARRKDGSTIPILGICYGMHYLASKFSGKVAAETPEHGRTTIKRTLPSFVFGQTPVEQQVWMNHGDSVVSVPEGFAVAAISRESGAIAAIENHEKQIFGVQFHPEATHTIYGKHVLENFLRFCRCAKDWSPSSIIDDIRDELEDVVGGEKVAMGFSGGVDSTVAAAIAAPVLKERLRGITLDADHLRQGELSEIDLHAKAAGLSHHVIDLRHTVALFAEITDAETKRKKVFQQGIYIPEMTRGIRDFGAQYFLQGTLAPDLIESGATGGDTIKTHHNVGIDVGVPQLHPLGNLFKYEVRALARELGLPEGVAERKPFPGPGLFIRVLGTPVTHELLECVRVSNEAVEQILRRDGTFWREEISQLVVAYLGVNTTGQKGDGRVYGGAIVVRAIKTLDFMTAEGLEIPREMWREIKSLVTKHPLVVRAFADSTDKPPATTEFE